jgi:hypothetical protein
VIRVEGSLKASRCLPLGVCVELELPRRECVWPVANLFL